MDAPGNWTRFIFFGRQTGLPIPFPLSSANLYNSGRPPTANSHISAPILQPKSAQKQAPAASPFPPISDQKCCISIGAFFLELYTNVRFGEVERKYSLVTRPLVDMNVTRKQPTWLTTKPPAPNHTHLLRTYHYLRNSHKPHKQVKQTVPDQKIRHIPHHHHDHNSPPCQPMLRPGRQVCKTNRVK